MRHHDRDGVHVCANNEKEGTEGIETFLDNKKGTKKEKNVNK